MKLHLSIERSGRHFAGSRWLSLALVTILSVPGAGFATLRGTVSPRSLGAKAGTESPAPTAGKSSVTPLKFSAQDGVTPLAGSVFTVNSAADPATNISCIFQGFACTLRAAINDANFTPGDDTINFAIPATDPTCLNASHCTINLTSALPNLSTNIAITGPGADKLEVRRDTGGNYRIFNVTVAAPGAVTLSGLRISNGLVDNNFGGGGGIQNFSSGTVNVTNCEVSFNHANSSSGFNSFGGGVFNNGTGTVSVNDSTLLLNSAAFGGGIYNAIGGTVNVSNSTISGNFAETNGVNDPSGGGIFNSGTVNVTNSTLLGNCTGSCSTQGQVFDLNASGGGIFNESGTLNVTNSTLDSNEAFAIGPRSARGGGIFIDTGTVNVTNSTLSNNSCIGFPSPTTFGGGIFNGGGLVKVKSTIIALNRVQAGSNPDASGQFTSQGFNLIGKRDGSSGFVAATDQTGTIASPLDPKLDSGLRSNGGPTQTIALLPSSAAIDKGTSAGLTGDQRGTSFPRTINDPLIANAIGGDGTDIGAFEKQTITPTLQFSSATYSVNENAGTATITVTRANDTGVDTTVDYATSNGTATAGTDYTATSGTLEFRSGDTSKTFSIPIINDTLNEPNEVVILTLSNVTGSAALGTPSSAVLTIVDDDPLPGLSINDVSVPEGNSGTTNANFTVSLSAASSQTVTVNYATANGTAAAGSDYVATSGTLTFTPGQTSKTIPITINGDTINEPNETFFVNLSSPTNATIARSKGTGTILNDDAPLIQFSAALFVVGEGDQRVNLTVTRSGDTSGAASVGFATIDDTGLQNCNVFNGVASPRCDFINTIGTMTFAAGETSKSFSVAIIDDSYAEGTENFTVSLSNPSGATLGSQSTATVMIVDNETTTGPNPIDNTNFFIRQQYLDFLAREPEPSCPPNQCGLDFYLPILNGCGNDIECLKYTRGALSANFFRSPEFQRKGNYVMYLYMVSIGQRPATLAELSDPTKVDRPHYAEFINDLASISTPNDDPALTEVKKDALAVAWLQRAEIQSKYGGLSNDQFVKTLESTAGVTLSSESTLIANLNNGSQTRAQVLRAVAESPEVNNKFYKQSFVTMEYFGYLRRDPEDCTNPQNWTNGDPSTCGYVFHNSRFQLAADPDFLENTIVRGFIESPEYHHRFGP